MWIATGQHGAAERTAERKSGDIAGEVDAVYFGAGERGSPGIWIAVHAECLGTQLIADNPDHVRFGLHARLGDVMTGGSAAVPRATEV